MSPLESGGSAIPPIAGGLDAPLASARSREPRLPLPRAVTLDLWHTLFYLEPEAEERYMAEQQELAVRFLERAPLAPGASDLDRGRLVALFTAEFSKAVAASQEGRTITPAEQLDCAAAAAGRLVATEEYLEALHALVARTPFQAADEAAEFLQAVRARGFRTALISNTTGEPGAALRPVIQRLGLDRYLDELVFSDERPWTKPAPEIFLDALRPLGADPSRTVHVGDGWVDIEGARRAGLRGGILFTGLQRYGRHYQGLFLPKGWENPPTPYRAARLLEIPAILDRLVPPVGPSSAR